MSYENNSEINSINTTDKENEETEPTEADLATLERIADRIPLAAWLIVICEFCERFAFIGLSGPLQNYIEFPPPYGNNTQSGALNRGHGTATLTLMCFSFMCYLTPILGAVVSDQYWGKYKTILIGCIIYVFGLSILVVSSLPYSINIGIAFPGLIVSMVIIAFATGSLKSNVSPMMAEQYTRTKPIVKIINGKKKIIDPAVTIQTMFNWFYWSINIGSLSTIISTNLEKYVSFWLAYLVPMIVFIGCIIVLITGRDKYIHKAPSGSLLVRAFRTISLAVRIRFKYGKQNDREHLLDYAKDSLLPINQAVKENEFIDQLKTVFHSCLIFTFFPLFWLCCIQSGTNMIYQASQMNDGPLPNDILQNLDSIIGLVLIPIFDKIIYPVLRRCHILSSQISRIALGFIFCSFAMAWTAYVQHLVYSTGPNFSYAIKPCPTCQQYNNISLAWQIPSYLFMSIGEIFGSVAGIEYAFTHAPSSMKSIVVSLFLFTSGVGAALNIVLIPIMIDPKLVWFFASLSGMSLVIGIVFFLLFRSDEKLHKK